MARRRNGRRVFLPEYKAALVAQWEAATTTREKTGILKRSGIARHQLSNWQRQFPAAANGNRPAPLDAQLEQVMGQISREIAFAAKVRALVEELNAGGKS